MNPISPIQKTIDEKTYILSKFPATKGREIVTQYVSTGLPKIGDYKRNEELMLKLMSYVGVIMQNNQTMLLTNQELVDNHVPSWEALVKIEIAMMEYNCSFFQEGRALNFLESIAQRAPAWIIKTLTRLLRQLSATVKQL
jgi:hypothetical protein